MKLYSLKGDTLHLHCSNYDEHEMHEVIDGVINENDWKHLLDEFPDHLTKVDPSILVVTEEPKPSEEVNNGIIS